MCVTMLSTVSRTDMTVVTADRKFVSLIPFFLASENCLLR